MDFDQKAFESIINKWGSLLSIRGTIFGMNGNQEKTLQIQFDAMAFNKMEPSFIEDSFNLFYVNLKELLGTETELTFVKVENIDFASHVFWDLAAMGLETHDEPKTIPTFFPPNRHPKKFYI